MGKITADSLVAGSITPDIAYSSARIRQILMEKLEEIRQDEDPEYFEDDYESGHAEGYQSGLMDGLLLALDTLEKPLERFKGR